MRPLSTLSFPQSCERVNEGPGVTVHRQIWARQRGIGVYNRAFITANVAVMAA